MKINADRWSSLALARFALAFIVAVNHLAEYSSLDWLLGIVPKFGAFEAILGFLLISGYSIAESIKKSPDGFYFRRIKRIYPVYLASVALAFWAFQPAVDAAFFWILAVNLLFLNQALTSVSFVGPAWSLSLEVWLYATAPWLKKQSEKTFAVLTCCSLLGYTVYTCGRTLWDWNYYAGVGHGLNLPLLAFMWLLGFWFSVTQYHRFVLQVIGLVMGYHLLLAWLIQAGYRLKNSALDLLPGDTAGFVFRGCTLLLVWWIFARIQRAPTGGVRNRVF